MGILFSVTFFSFLYKHYFFLGKCRKLEDILIYTDTRQQDFENSDDDGWPCTEDVDTSICNESRREDDDVHND